MGSQCALVSKSLPVRATCSRFGSEELLFGTIINPLGFDILMVCFAFTQCRSFHNLLWICSSFQKPPWKGTVTLMRTVESSVFKDSSKRVLPCTSRLIYFLWIILWIILVYLFIKYQHNSWDKIMDLKAWVIFGLVIWYLMYSMSEHEVSFVASTWTKLQSFCWIGKHWKIDIVE